MHYWSTCYSHLFLLIFAEKLLFLSIVYIYYRLYISHVDNREPGTDYDGDLKKNKTVVRFKIICLQKSQRQTNYAILLIRYKAMLPKPLNSPEGGIYCYDRNTMGGDFGGDAS